MMKQKRVGRRFAVKRYSARPKTRDGSSAQRVPSSRAGALGREVPVDHDPESGVGEPGYHGGLLRHVRRFLPECFSASAARTAMRSRPTVRLSIHNMHRFKADGRISRFVRAASLPKGSRRRPHRVMGARQRPMLLKPALHEGRAEHGQVNAQGWMKNAEH